MVTRPPLRELLSETVRFLTGLEPLQHELERIYQSRLSALATADPAELERLNALEQEVVPRLRRHLQQRGSILKAARQAGCPANSLKQLLSMLPSRRGPADESDGLGAADAELREAGRLMDRIERQSWRLRQASWASWHVVRRACREFSELRSILANCGEPSASDGHDPRPTAVGGALLDASV